MRYCLRIMVLLYSITSVSWAKHIVGGYISVWFVNQASSEYRVSLHLIYDDNLGATGNEKAFVSIFRKKDNMRVADFTLSLQTKTPLDFSNASCAITPSDSKLLQHIYTTNVTLSPNAYNDEQGYYIAWEECCRNENIVNIQTPNKVGMVLYTELPPATIPNSSPTFKDLAPKYICVGKGFELDLGATDADNDQLRYSVVTPLVGITQGGGIFPAKPNAGGYLSAKWTTGFDTTQAIKGSIPLRIDRQGKLIVNTSQIGTYAVTIRCEEWRNGIKIGEVRRELMLLVIDCKNTTVPTPKVELKQATNSVETVTNSEGSISSVKFCSTDSVVVKAVDENPIWQYIWQYEGKDIQGANTISLTLKKAGKYTLIRKMRESCSTSDSAYSTVTVAIRNASTVKITSSNGTTLCQGDSTNLSVSPMISGSFRWQSEPKDLLGILPTLIGVKTAGLYKVEVIDAASKCILKDSIQLKVAPKPTAPVTTTGGLVFCSQDSTKLSTIKQSHYEYIWYKDNVPLVAGTTYIIQPTQTGLYKVTITDSITNCKATSTPLQVIVRQSPTIVFDSIPPLCGGGIQAVALYATPAGGTYSGRGVIAGRFVSQSLPAGKYPVTYTYISKEGCKSTATRNVTIQMPPRISMPENITILKGDKAEIKTTIPEKATIFWSPAEGLSDTQISSPTATPQYTTTYYARITTAEGCIIENQVKVEVIELVINNGFTPNGDGINDSWEIEGIAKYPNCTVEVFDRWGSSLYKSVGYQDAWNGTWQGKEVPVGTYYYQIYLRELNYRLSGSVSIMR